MEHMSWDSIYEILTRLQLTQNPVSGNLERVTAIQGNPSLALTYNEGGNLTQIQKTIDGITYTKTFTWDVDRLIAVSAWS
jgi:hypothetical protein